MPDSLSVAATSSIGGDSRGVVHRAVVNRVAVDRLADPEMIEVSGEHDVLVLEPGSSPGSTAATFCDSTSDRFTATVAFSRAGIAKWGNGLPASAASRISWKEWPEPASHGRPGRG